MIVTDRIQLFTMAFEIGFFNNIVNSGNRISCRLFKIFPRYDALLRSASARALLQIL